jgi:hypothetical protein
MRFPAFCLFLLAAACSGDDQAGACSPAGTLQLDLVYMSGDCLPEGFEEKITFEVEQIGATYQARERGDLVDSTLWNSEACELVIKTSFYFPETADSWEIEGTVEYQIDLNENPPGGFGQLDATIYPNSGPDDCSQIIGIN